MREELGDGVLLLRPPTPDDAPLHAEAARESWREVSAWLSWCHEGYTADESAAWIEGTMEGRKRGEVFEWLIFERRSDRFLGGCSLRPIAPHTRVANCGYWLRTSESGRGFMTRAVRMVLDFGFKDLGLQRIEIVMQPENVASRRVAEKVGARYEGILRNRIPWPGGNVDALGYAVIPSDLD